MTAKKTTTRLPGRTVSRINVFFETNPLSGLEPKFSPKTLADCCVFVLEKEPTAAELLRLRSVLVDKAKPPYAVWWPGCDTGTDAQSALKSYHQRWSTAQPSGLLQIGHTGALSDKAKMQSDTPELLTFPGMVALRPVIDALDEARRRYRQLMPSRSQKLLRDRREVIHKAIKALFDECREHGPKVLEKANALREALKQEFMAPPHLDPAALPRVLILGESGAGKTLATQYLAWRSTALLEEGQTRTIKRLPLPDFLNAEDKFIGAMFGYMPGAYTGARQGGSFGAVLENLGGVLFLDEIGEASPALQAKLLAFLDDYSVSPMDWEGGGFTCPVLLVAATNRPVDKWAQPLEDGTPDPRFRHDLYWRFDTVVRLPSLNERKATEMPVIVDSLLQLDAVNPATQGVTHYTKAFVEALKAVDYRDANFRLLTRLLKSAVQQAVRGGRHYVDVCDIAKDARSMANPRAAQPRDP